MVVSKINQIMEIKKSGKQGRKQKYSNLAIETILTVRLFFHLPLRQTEGFVMSLFHMMKVSLPIPDHTTLSRRSSTERTEESREVEAKIACQILNHFL